MRTSPSLTTPLFTTEKNRVITKAHRTTLPASWLRTEGEPVVKKFLTEVWANLIKLVRLDDDCRTTSRRS